MTKKLIDAAKQRSNIYGLLSLLFRTEISKQLLEELRSPAFLSILSEMGAELEDDFLKKPEKKLVKDLAVEYARLFVGPGKHISPHESVHHERDDGDWGTLWGKGTVEVKRFIESLGLEYKEEYSGIPDHISVELEFMQRLLEEEASAREKKDDKEIQGFLEVEKLFFERHLISWVPGFCDKVMAMSDISFYREVARVTKYYMEFEKETVSLLQVNTLGG